jgi:hypothetical protein
VYGLAANLAARVSGLAPPGAVVVSDAVETLIRNDFELKTRPAAPVKGVEEPITHYRVVGERVEPARVARGPLLGRDRELGRLEKSWARAQVGMLTTPGVAFRGEPGIGKSRLAAAAGELVEASGAVVLELVGISRERVRDSPASVNRPSRRTMGAKTATAVLWARRSTSVALRKAARSTIWNVTGRMYGNGVDPQWNATIGTPWGVGRLFDSLKLWA